MTKQVYQYWGEGLALGISGTRDEVERTCNCMYNFNITNSEPIWMNDNSEASFAYVLTDWKRLRKGLADKFITGFLTNRKMKAKRFKRGFMPLALIKADNKLSEIMSEQFLGHKRGADSVFPLPCIQNTNDDTDVKV